MDDIYEIERRGNFNEVVQSNYESRINSFDVDEEFTTLWSEDFAKHNGFTAKMFINILEDDAEQFDNIQYN